MNTARAEAVKDLLSLCGVSDPYRKLPKAPQHLPNKPTSTDAINALVTLRGEIVHTGAVPDTLKKHHAKEWREFVVGVVETIEVTCRKQCKKVLGL